MRLAVQLILVSLIVVAGTTIGGYVYINSLTVTTAVHESSTPHPRSTFASILAVPQTGNVPLTVSFEAIDSAHGMFGSPISYSWDFGDGNKNNERTVSHTFEAPGEYSVTLTISYEDQTDQTDIVKITTRASTKPTVTSSAVLTPTPTEERTVLGS